MHLNNNTFSILLDPTSVNGLSVGANGLKLAEATSDTYSGVAASGTYVSGTKYYTTAACTVEVDTSSFVAGETDVSGYYVLQKTEGVTGAMSSVFLIRMRGVEIDGRPELRNPIAVNG